MTKWVLLIGASCGFFATCGDKNTIEANEIRGNEDATGRLPKLERQLAELRDAQHKIESLVKSEFANCDETGETKDPLINRMCTVAQAATVESRIEMQAQLAKFSKSLNEKISALTDDFARLNESVLSTDARIATLEAGISELQNNITALTARVTSAESAIKALQDSLAGIKTSLSNTVEAIEIGAENVAAGPVYETLLRKFDRSSIVAYGEDYGTVLPIDGKNAIVATNGSDVATVPQGGDTLSVGDTLRATACVGDLKVFSVHINGEFRVTSVGPATGGKTPFTFKMERKTSGNTTVGGDTCTIVQLGSRGLRRIWQVSDGEDSVVRSTTWSSMPYNYIVRMQSGVWSVCYDKDSAQATFDALRAGGSSVICK